MAETTLFSEKGYKIVMDSRDTSGSVTVVTPGGQRSVHGDANEGRKYITKLLKENGEYGKGAFGNGRAKAEQAISNKMQAVGVQNAIRSMSKSEIIKRAREGRWELVQDVDGKRNGQHVEVRLPSGKSQIVQIEGD